MLTPPAPLSGLLPQADPGDQRAEQPAAGAPQAAVITRSGAARAETGQGERDGRRDGASAQSPQREGIPDQGTCSWVWLRPSSLLHALFTYDFMQQELMEGQEEEMLSSSKASQAEMKVLQEEMQLVLKKEREAQVPVRTQSFTTETILIVFFFFPNYFISCFAE